MSIMLALKRPSLVDAIQYNSTWGISRWKSEKDRAQKKEYSKEEALSAFGVPQHTKIQGNLVGACQGVGLLLAAIRAGEPLSDLVKRFGHLFKGNLLLNEGINELWTIVGSASSGTKFDNSNAYLGVGDSATAEDASQTGLQAATNKLYKAMDTSYPTYGTSQKITFRSTYGSSDANYDWREFTAANGNSDSAKNLNRKVSSQGTKAVGQTWELTLAITLS